MNQKITAIPLQRILAIFVLFMVVLFSGGGCFDSSSSSKSSKDNNGETENGADDPTCRVLLYDDFSGPLSANWATGTNTLNNPGGPTVQIEDQQVKFTQLYDYIETKQAFSGNFKVEMNISRITGSNQCADFYIELVGLDGVAAIMRFRYGTDAKESINIGTPPISGEAGTWDCIRDPAYLEELDHVGDSTGVITLFYENGFVQVSYTDSEGETITTNMMQAGSFSSSKVRIWGLGGVGTARYIDDVLICSPDEDDPGTGNGDENGDENGDVNGDEQLSFRIEGTSYSSDLCVGTYFLSDNMTSVMGQEDNEWTINIDYNGKGPGSFQGEAFLFFDVLNVYVSEDLDVTISSFGNVGGMITGAFSGTFVNLADESDTIEVTSGAFSATRTPDAE